MTNEIKISDEETADVTPPAERIAEGLRDTGYDLNTAVADIIDNSIAAGAKNIEVEFILDARGNVRFSIADDGSGMDRDGLINALTYGAARRASAASLGKFGLGLKTASTAFARRLVVMSRPDGNSANINAYVWDLDEVSRLGWKIVRIPSPEERDVERLEKFAPGRSGTLVRWEKIDRVMERNYQQPTGAHASNAIKKKQDSLRDHVAMVFHRFLDENDDRAENVKINLNQTPIEAWNPFAWNAELLLNQEQIEITKDKGDSALMSVRAFVLPRKADMQAALGEDSPKKARLSNDYQGIYVFRENRMIHGPDWLNIWSKEPHFSLARVELSFDHKLDDDFKIDVKKSRIILSDEIHGEVEKMIAPPRNEANNRYRNGKTVDVASSAGPNIHAASNAAIGEKSKAIASPKLDHVDATSGEATIENKHGGVSVKYVESLASGIYVVPVPELPDGLLYQPAYIGTNPGVRINMSHPYYEKVYLPNKETSATIQGLDSLLWALASAEFRSKSDETSDVFEDIRYDLSRALKRLVEDLPGPLEED